MKGFKRVGNDIEVEVNISFIEAILGAEIEVKTLNGHLKVKIPQGSSTGNRLRVKGKGIKKDNVAGNLIVLLKVVMPKYIDPALQNAVKSWKGKFDYNPREMTQQSERNEDSGNEYHV